MNHVNTYSELEYLVLAMVGEGVNSGYGIRKKMTLMRGGRWSSESGSVYRVLRRLEREGLINEARRVGVTNRERTEYEITAHGHATVHRWLTLPPDHTEYNYLVDPLRTRGYFLLRLEPADQIRTVRMWLAESKRFLSHLERETKVYELGDTIPGFVIENVIFLAKARHDWLKKLLVKVREAYKDDLPKAAKSLASLK